MYFCVQSMPLRKVTCVFLFAVCAIEASERVFLFAVYAIEASEMAEQARKIVKENNMADRTDIIQKISEVRTVMARCVSSTCSKDYNYIYL